MSFFPFSQILRRPRPNRRKIAIDRLHDLSQPSVIVIFLIPLIFVVLDSLAWAFTVFFDGTRKRQSDEVVDVEGLGR